MKDTVGIVGLGIMGGAIACNLAATDYRVIGFDIDRARRRELSVQGIASAERIPELVDSTDLILTSLPDATALRSTIRAICNTTFGRKTVIEASTLSLTDKLEMKRLLESSGHIPLDCPISGSGAQATTKDLVIYASGNSARIAELESFFMSFARQVYNVGEFGNGSRVKFVANLLVAINNVATAEAMVLAGRAGLDLKKVVEWISAGSGSSRIFEKRAPLMADTQYLPATMKLSVWRKDLDIIDEFAKNLHSPTPLLSATLPIYAAAVATRSGDEDTASVCAVLEAIAASGDGAF